MIAFNSNYCDLSLVNEARKNVEKLKEQGEYFFIFVGHSLGGTAAQCLATIYPNSRSIALNGGNYPECSANKQELLQLILFLLVRGSVELDFTISWAI